MLLAPTQLQMTVVARAAVIAWLNAFQATSQDPEKPTLYRTLALEWFEDGIQLVATDGTLLFRTWVPSQETPDAKWPGPGSIRVPYASIVVMDPDAFGLAFLRALLRVTGEESHALEELTLTTAPADDEATIPLGTEFMTQRLTLRACGQRIDLRLLDNPYPNWRGVQLGIDAAERVEGMKIAPRMFALLARLRGVTAVDCEFYGEGGHIRFVATGDREVRGLIMPMRREVDRSEEKAQRQQDAKEKAAQTDAFAAGASGETGGGHPAGEVIKDGWIPEEPGEDPEVDAAVEAWADSLSPDAIPESEPLDPPPPKLTDDDVQEMRAAVEAGIAGESASPPKRSRKRAASQEA